MKYQLRIAMTLALSLLFSTKLQARASEVPDRDHGPRYRMTRVPMVGTLRCENDSKAADTRCELEFVDEISGDKWDVRNSQSVADALSGKANPRGLRVRIDAERSPRFLLGGSFVDIRGIEPLSTGESPARSIAE